MSVYISMVITVATVLILAMIAGIYLKLEYKALCNKVDILKEVIDSHATLRACLLARTSINIEDEDTNDLTKIDSNIFITQIIEALALDVKIKDGLLHIEATDETFKRLKGSENT